MVRVLHVMGKMDRGGAESMLMNIYRHVNREAIQFDFVVHSSDSSAYDSEIKAMGGKIYCVPRYKGWNHFAYCRWWNDFFNAHPEYTITHSHIRSTANIILKYAKKHGSFTIAHSHSTSNGRGLSAVAKKVFQRGICKYSDSRFACSDEAGKWLFGNIFYQIINNAIDTSMFAFDSAKREATRNTLSINNRFVIGHVGRFIDAKNHVFLIDLFQAIHAMLPKAILLLVGDGALKKEIERKVSMRGLNDAVIFAGERKDVQDLLQAMDVFIFPSKYEGLPLTLIEAQTAGLPCLVSDTVTRDVAITHLIDYIPLSASTDLWIEKVMAYTTGYDRRDMRKDIIQANFDIIKNAEYMENYYLSITHPSER